MLKSISFIHSLCAIALVATAVTLGTGCNPNRSSDNADTGSATHRSTTDTQTTTNNAGTPGNNSGVSTSDSNSQQPGQQPGMMPSQQPGTAASQQPGVLYNDPNSAGAARPGDVGPHGAENPPLKNPAAGNATDTTGSNGMQQ
jgi:hypothetical protein